MFQTQILPRYFNRRTVKALALRGIRIVGSQLSGPYAPVPDFLAVVEAIDGQMALTFSQVRVLAAGSGVLGSFEAVRAEVAL